MADPFIGHTVLKKFPGYGKEPWEGRVEKAVGDGKYLVFFERDGSEFTMTSKALVALGLGSPAPAAAGVGKRRRAATSTSAAAPAGKKGKAKVKAKVVAKAKVEVKAKAKAKPVKGKAKARKRADMAPAAAAATTSGAVAVDAIAIDLADDDDAEENAATTGKRARRAVGKAEGGASSRKGVGSSKRITGKSGMEVVDIDADESDGAGAGGSGSGGGSGAAAEEDSDSDDDVVEVDAEEVAAAESAAASSSSSGSSSSSSAAGAKAGGADVDDDEDSEEDVALVGSTGTNSLIDFPHSREHCVTHPFASTDHEAHCSNCFCMVCDLPADKCQAWDAASSADPHCNAVYAMQKWKTLRTQRQQAAAAAAAPQASSSSSSSSSSTAAAATAAAAAAPLSATVQAELASYRSRYTENQRSRVGGNSRSCDAIMTMTEQVRVTSPAIPHTPILTSCFRNPVLFIGSTNT